MRCVPSMCVALIACNSPPPQPPPASGPVNYGESVSTEPELVSFASGSLTLSGFLFAPPGAGPFPAVVFNHGSEEYPGQGRSLAPFYLDNGFVFFVPHRRGHGRSKAAGPYIGSAFDDAEPDSPALTNALVEQSDDVMAAVAYVATLPYVDAKRVANVGCSFGGIEALLAAERGTGLVAAINFAGAAIMWSRSAPLRERMKQAARNARVPVFFIQAENDFDTTPSRVLSEEMKRAGKPTRMRVFPPAGATPQEGHGFCVRGDNPAWGPDVLAFLAETMKR